MRFERKWTRCTVHAIRDVTPAIREFVLRPEPFRPEHFAPGSHVAVGVSIDGRPETRCYSLVGDSGPDGYRIAVRRAPDSRGGSRYMWSLKPGARVEVSTPASLFEIDWTRKSWCLIARRVDAANANSDTSPSHVHHVGDQEGVDAAALSPAAAAIDLSVQLGRSSRTAALRRPLRRLIRR